MKRQILLLISFSLFYAQLIGQTWSNVEVASGVKPDIEVASDGSIHLAYILQNSTNGIIYYAERATTASDFSETTIMSKGVFGPCDLELDSSNEPYISYTSIEGSIINGEVLSDQGSGWSPKVAIADGPDGWDGSMILVNDLPVVAGIDGGENRALEIATYGSSPQATVEVAVADQGINIDYGCSITADANNNLAAYFYNEVDSTLYYTHKPDGDWITQEIAKYGLAPNAEFGNNGPVVAFYQANQAGDGKYASNGNIVLASLNGGTWSLDTIAAVTNLTLNRQNDGQEPVDLEIGSDGSLHMAYADAANIIYATQGANGWDLDTAVTSAIKTGQQVALDLDSNNEPHISYYTTGDDDKVYYLSYQQEQPVMLTIDCPLDTTLACGSSIDTSITGVATTDSLGVLTYRDSIMQDCPMDRVVHRVWTATSDTDTTTCTQIITIEKGDIGMNALVQDTFMIAGMCPADVMAMASDSITMACGSVVDSITTATLTNTCDTLEMTRTWHISATCGDSSITLAQYILATDLPYLDVTDTTIVTSDAGEMNGSIAISLACGNDNISYQWSDGSTDAVLDSVGSGDYGVTITSALGCSDSLSLSIGDTPLSFVCPGDTVITCDFFIIPEFTGKPVVTGYDSTFSVDNVTSTCPDDIVIERTWYATKDTIRDSCVQVITMSVDSFAMVDLRDTLIFDGICLNEIPTLLEESIDLPCNLTVDSIAMNRVSTECDRIEYSAAWDFSIDCADSIINGLQTIIINNPILYEVEESSIVYDTANNVATAMITDDCRGDSVSIVWSTGSDSSLVDVAPGTYQIYASNTMGCTDTIDFVIAAIMQDTMPVDTMMMVEQTMTCPRDTMVSCDADVSTMSLGMGTQTGYDTIVYVDMVTDTCPGDMVISRLWIASDDNGADSCTQTITVMRDGLSKISAPDTVSFSGLCADEVAGALAIDTIALSCGVVLADVTTTQDTTAMMGTEAYDRVWTFIDTCKMDTLNIAQKLIFNDFANVKLSNIAVTPDDGDTTGMITYDIACAPDSLSFSWSDGSMDTLRSALTAGNYTLTISDTSGVLDSFMFLVEMSMDTMPVDTMMMVEQTLTCARDTMVSCDADVSPMSLGMATQTGYDTLVFVDIVTDTCPGDMVISRLWIASDDNGADSCMQTITVMRDGLSKISAPDTVSFSGLCADEVAGALMIDTMALSCGIVMSDVTTTADTTAAMGTEAYDRVWTFIDTCQADTLVINQKLLFTDFTTLRLTNIDITPDNGDTTGAISYDFACAPDSLSFSWSDGSMDTLRSGLTAGNYTLTISDTSGVLDSFLFEVMMEDTNMVEKMLVCPADTTVSCNVDLSASNLGMATQMGYDTLVFVDMLTDTCPTEPVLSRLWIAMDSTSADTCTQQITIRRDGLDKISVTDTLRNSGLCLEEISLALEAATNIDLPCGTRIDTVMLTQDTNVVSGAAIYHRSWTFINACDTDTLTLNQTLIYTDIQAAKIENIVVTPANNDSSGTISYDIICIPDSTTFEWSDGSMDTMRTGLPAGDYTLNIRDTSGLVDTYDFTIIDTGRVEPMFVCPLDTVIACNSGTDPDDLNMPFVVGFDTLFYADSISNFGCPSDEEILRTWTAMRDTFVETCVQKITISADGLDLIDLADTLRLQGVCLSDVANGTLDTLDLACDVVLDTIVMNIRTQSCDAIRLQRTLTYFDNCTQARRIISQEVIMTDVPVAKSVTETIREDLMDSLGSISLDIVSCDTSDLDVMWSTGDTTHAIDSLSAGDYFVTLTNTAGCVDTFNYSIKSVDTTAFNIIIAERNGVAFNPDSIRVKRENGNTVVVAVRKVADGEYQFTSEQTIIRGDQICMQRADDAARLTSVRDLIRGRRHILGLEVACDDDVLAGDVNFSGDVSGSDLAAMQRVILGRDTSYVHGRSWIFTSGLLTPSTTQRMEGCIELTQDQVDERRVRVKAIKLGDYICNDQ